ncbi:probable anion transporter 3, chloroplastic isoform X2 [Cimex lectularius]|nr:probable anion transporter 3, chloroplastic isoform X2 [Cimex lectularius]
MCPILFTGRLLGAIAPLFFCSKYIILVTSLVQSVALIAIPLLMTSQEDLFKATLLVIEIVTIFQIPAAYTFMSRWTPHHELGKHMTVLSTGTYFAFFTYVQIDSFFRMNYRVTYFLGGSLTLVWCFLWLVFSAPDPHKCFYISKEEQRYLFHNIPHIRKVAINVPVPLKKMLSCLPLYGFLLVDLSVEIYKISGRYYKLTNSFFMNILHFQNAEGPQSIASMLIGDCFFIIIAGVITDRLIEKGVNLNNTRKSVSSIALWGSGIAMAFLGYCTNHVNIRVAFNVSFYLRSLAIVGPITVPFDISQNYGGFIIGISRTISTLLFPMVNNIERDILRRAIIKEVWDYYSYGTGGAIFVANTIFLMCGDIYKRDFDTVGSYDWRHESIHSYP